MPRICRKIRTIGNSKRDPKRNDHLDHEAEVVARREQAREVFAADLAEKVERPLDAPVGQAGTAKKSATPPQTKGRA